MFGDLCEEGASQQSSPSFTSIICRVHVPPITAQAEHGPAPTSCFFSSFIVPLPFPLIFSFCLVLYSVPPSKSLPRLVAKMHCLRHAAARSAARLQAGFLRQGSLRRATTNAAAVLPKGEFSEPKQPRPRLQNLRKRLEADAMSSPRQFVSKDAPDRNADAPGNTAASAATAATVQKRVQAQIAQAVAAFPHIDFNDSTSRAVLCDSFGRQHNYLR